jgi:probable phosphoglycerate mutase
VKKVILVRHGFTFEAGERSVWVGAQQDLPLVPRGVTAIKALGEFLAEQKLVVDELWSGTLLRSRTSADILASRLGLPVKLDKRLNELDFGSWGGLSDQELTDRGCGDKIADWRAQAEWQEEFGESRAQFIDRLHSVASEVLYKSRGDTVLLVTSSAVIRFFFTLLPQNRALCCLQEIKVAPAEGLIFNATLDGNWVFRSRVVFEEHQFKVR